MDARPDLVTSCRPLPIALEDITPAWLTAALRIKAPGVTVRGFEVVDLIRSTTTKVRLRLDLDEAGRRAGIPELVILKGGFEPHSRGLGHMHEKEVRGYRDVYPVLPLPSPACYFADYEAERQQGIVIMEDLVARGVEFCHATRPQSHEQIARRLTLLARFHARSWDSPDLAPGGRWGDLDEFLVTLQGFFDKYTAPDVWRRFIGMPRGAAASVRFHDRDWMVDAFVRLNRFALQVPHCVLHGDVHLGNLYIDRDGTPGFLDTLASRGPGLLEVSYHLSASLDAADRRRSEGALLQHYLDELGRNGVDPPPFDEAWRQYGIFLLYGYFIWITTESHYQTEAVNTANAARVSAAMLDHDIDRLLATIPA
ncbi:phosphotransferase [Phenylobacterium sp. LjRoot225]|uniref:phosphotransferase family protein n=1 Tax=Phenylobacterium sp. LjRoot225 TaxID=3342285 RepID=UPI003ECDAA58